MARAVFMAKEEGTQLDPLSYRVLTMLPASYRLYAKIRLKHLQPWIAEWVTPDIHAGVEGQGAADAAYETAVRMELDRLRGEACTGGAADVYKCFEQIRRQLLYKIMEETGMPQRIRRACQNFQENLEVHNTIAGGMGEAHKKPTSIPQGDPFSMMLTSLLMRAWIMQMHAMAVQPRLLADDLQILCTEPNRLQLFGAGFTTTQEHLEDMGARLAPSKSMTFPTDVATGGWLRKHKWRKINRTIAVVTDCRDLGAHLTATEGRWHGKTLARRMLQVADETERLNRIKAPYVEKAALIRAKKLPTALYGCEVTPVNETALRVLRSSFVRCMTYTTVRRSADLVFAMASEGSDLDPDINVFVRSVAVARRYLTTNKQGIKR